MSNLTLLATLSISLGTTTVAPRSPPPASPLRTRGTSPGVWTFDFTVDLAAGSYTLFAQAKDSYGVLGDPFALALTVV